jgi:hypothetical protein
MNKNHRAGGVLPVHFASAIVLALEAGARLSGSLDDEDWSLCRRLLIADSRHQLERLCNLMADAVSMARALGVLDAAAMVPE